MSVRSGWIACGIMTIVVTAGCSTFTSNKKSPKKDSIWTVSKLWEKEYQQPHKLAVVWSADTLAMPGKPPTRGFGGRIYFYNDKSQVIPVEGELYVHGFKDTTLRLASTSPKADKTFGFTAEQFTQHYSATELGASYSVWIPWDAADGFLEEITLIPSFKASNGQVVQGSATKLVLPGRSRIDPEFQLPAQTVSYAESSTPTNLVGTLPQLNGKTARNRSPDEGITTIDIPSSTVRRLGVRAAPASYVSNHGQSDDWSSAIATQGVSVGGKLQNEEWNSQLPQVNPAWNPTR